jgi:hypothetical protein
LQCNDERGGIDGCNRPIIHQSGRACCAQAKAINRLERDVRKGGLQLFRHGGGAARLARLRLADLDHPWRRRLAAEIMVEADDAEHLRAAEVQHLGYRGHRRIVDVARLVLHGMEQGQEAAAYIRLRARDPPHDFRPILAVLVVHDPAFLPRPFCAHGRDGSN